MTITVRDEPVINRLRAIASDLSGIAIADIQPQVNLLELGFDSLFLTQLSTAYQKEFGVRITFRQLFTDFPTLASLGAYIESNLPAGKTGAPAPVPVLAPLAPVPALQMTDKAVPERSVDQSGALVSDSRASAPMSPQLESIVLQQLELMTEQLRLLGQIPSESVPATKVVHSGNDFAPQLAAPIAASPKAATEVGLSTGFGTGNVKHSNTQPLTPSQARHLERLIHNYTRKTAGSKQRTQQYRPILADPRTASGFNRRWKEMVYPIWVERSQGSKLWDVDGNQYIDMLNGFGPNFFGHAPEFLIQAISDQLQRGFEVGPQTPLVGETAEMICQLTGMDRASFMCSGSEAVQAAMRLSRTVTGRDKVVVFSRDYHGNFDQVLVREGNRSGKLRTFPSAPGIPAQSVDDTYVLEYGAEESLQVIRQHAEEIAAVLVEPVQSRRPEFQPREFLHELRRITRENGIIFVFDEVITGFRIAPGGAQSFYGIDADLATYGKVLAGGMPIGVVAGRKWVMDAFDGGMWQYGDDSFPEVGVTFFAGTFVRHPLAIAAAHASLRHIIKEGPALQERIAAKTAGFVAEVRRLIAEVGADIEFPHFSSLMYLRIKEQSELANLLYFHLRYHGVHILEGFPAYMTDAHSDADIAQVIKAFRDSLAEMSADGLFRVQPQLLQAPAVELVREAPLTEPQLEILLSDQLGLAASCSFNESFSLHLYGALNEAVLRRALQQIIDRHDALRITVAPDGERILIVPKIAIEIPVTDLSSHPDLLAEVIRADAQEPFRLSTGPLVRMQIIRMAPDHNVLLFTAHHIVCDGWSANVIVDELSKLYNAAVAGVPANLPPATSFETYARQQKAFIDSPEGVKIEQYWVEQFKQPPPPLDLPLDRPRPAIKEFAGATIRHRIGGEIYQNLRKASASQKCTVFVTLLSAFQILLHRLSGQDDIVVGIPTAGQSVLDGETLVGHCVNFLPLRGQIHNGETAAAFLAQMKQTVLDGYDNQNYTYGRLVRQLSIPRDPSRLPITEVQFNVERLGEGTRFEGLEIEIDPNPKCFVNFDIFFNIVESKDGLTIDCDFNTGLFDHSTIERWLAHYEALLAGIAADAQTPIAKLPMFSPEELKRYLASSNPEPVWFPEHLCVHQLFEEQAEVWPDRVAVDFEDQHLTYAELNARSNQLAHYLLQLGVGPGTLTGILVDRSLDMIVALLAVQKAGGAYIPMDPTYPPERIAFVLDDAETPVLISQQKLETLWPQSRKATIVKLDADWPQISSRRTTNPNSPVASTDLAYVIYTSGSTGKPKGVEVQHRALVNFLCSMKKKPGMSAGDVLLAVTTLSFDIAGMEMFLPLVTGARLVIATRDTAADGNQLLARLRSCGATMIQATPITFRLMLEAGWKDLPLKVLCGGEALPRDLANQILEHAAELWNMYGPTETTIWSSTLQIMPGDDPILLGPPIDNTTFYVLDPAGQLAPIGVEGELCIGGDGVARGYYRRPELTADRFIPDPFTSIPGARLYRTGDRVRRRAGGLYEFLGRLDFQVKLRGFRIELGEIETALQKFPGVRQAVVILREDTPNDQRLVAYLATDQTDLSVSAVRDFLTAQLPAYMAPAAIVRMDAMPLTPNGKVNRKALPAPEGPSVPPKRTIVAPRDDRERMLASIWAEVLRVDQVSIDDNLFELGADSLQLFQIASRSARAGFKITPAQLLRSRTIAALTSQLTKNVPAVETLKPIAAVTRVSREKFAVKP